MSSLLTHFEERAASLSGCASLQRTEENGATFLRLAPHRLNAVGAVLYKAPGGDHGTVKLDDRAAVPIELGEDLRLDLEAIDQVIDTAVHGRVTAFHIGRGGCVEASDGGTASRYWNNALPWPGWRRRAHRVDYLPYR